MNLVSLTELINYINNVCIYFDSSIDFGFYTIINKNFITIDFSMVKGEYFHIWFLFIVNIGLVLFFLSFIFPKSWIRVIAIVAFCYQMMEIYRIKLVLRIFDVFPTGITYSFYHFPGIPDVNYGYLLTLLSFNFVLISTFITVLTILYTFKHSVYSALLLRLIFIINFFSINVFLVDEFLLFFLFLECSVLPMVYLIYQFGPRAERSKAAYTYFYYSIFASFLLFLGVAGLYSIFSTTTLKGILPNSGFDVVNRTLGFDILFLLTFFGLAIKLPIFPAHIWLPEAHGEASTIGSVFLAGTYLKMALFGIINYCVPIFYVQIDKFTPLIMAFCLLGVLIPSVNLLNSFDLKKFVAYTSIVHMNFILIGVILNTELSLLGSIYSAFIHSFITGMLFFLVGWIYEIVHTRNVLNFSSFIDLNLTPSLRFASALLMYFLLVNASVPIGPTFVGETIISLQLAQSYPIIMCLCWAGLGITAIAHYKLINQLYSLDNIVARAYTTAQYYYLVHVKVKGRELFFFYLTLFIIYMMLRVAILPSLLLKDSASYINLLHPAGLFNSTKQ